MSHNTYKIKQRVCRIKDYLSRLFFMLGMTLVPILTYADGTTDNDMASSLDRLNKVAISAKIFALNTVMVVGVALIIYSIMLMIRKDPNKSTLKAGVIFMAGALACAPAAIVDTIGHSITGKDASTNMTQSFSDNGG